MDQKSSAKYVYLAAPFFNEKEIRTVEYAEKVLQEKGLLLFSPMRHTVDAEPHTPEWADMIFEMDVTELKKADVAIVLYDDNYGDTGTAWECGYAFARGIPVVLVHTNRDAESNLMLHCGCHTNIWLDELAGYDFDSMPVYRYEGKMI